MVEKWLIGCENSQEITLRLRAKGIQAYSCDLLPVNNQMDFFKETANSKYHIQGNVLDLIQEKWYAGIFHPTCTFLATSNTYINRGCSLYTPEEAIILRKQAIEFFNMFTDLKNIKKTAIENPVGIMSTLYRKPDQIIQPYNFGDNASKRTCLWLKGFPLLKHTKHIKPTIINGRKFWANQTHSGQNKLGPSNNRWAIRSRTYPGIAEAISEQWI